MSIFFVVIIASKARLAAAAPTVGRCSCRRAASISARRKRRSSRNRWASSAKKPPFDIHKLLWLPHEIKAGVEKNQLKVRFARYGERNLFLQLPDVIFADKIHAHVIGADGTVKKHEVRLPGKSELTTIVAVLAPICFKDQSH